MRLYLYEVEGYYSGRWESVFASETEEGANQILEDYRNNEKGTAFRVRLVRQ